jgi:hypothetical protein
MAEVMPPSPQSLALINLIYCPEYLASLIPENTLEYMILVSDSGSLSIMAHTKLMPTICTAEGHLNLLQILSTQFCVIHRPVSSTLIIHPVFAFCKCDLHLLSPGRWFCTELWIKLCLVVLLEAFGIGMSDCSIVEEFGPQDQTSPSLLLLCLGL